MRTASVGSYLNPAFAATLLEFSMRRRARRMPEGAREVARLVSRRASHLLPSGRSR